MINAPRHAMRTRLCRTYIIPVVSWAHKRGWLDSIVVKAAEDPLETREGFRARRPRRATPEEVASALISLLCDGAIAGLAIAGALGLMLLLDWTQGLALGTAPRVTVELLWLPVMRLPALPGIGWIFSIAGITVMCAVSVALIHGPLGLLKSLIANRICGDLEPLYRERLDAVCAQQQQLYALFLSPAFHRAEDQSLARSAGTVSLRQLRRFLGALGYAGAIYTGYPAPYPKVATRRYLRESLADARAGGALPLYADRIERLARYTWMAVRVVRDELERPRVMNTACADELAPYAFELTLAAMLVHADLARAYAHTWDDACSPYASAVVRTLVAAALRELFQPRGTVEVALRRAAQYGYDDANCASAYIRKVAPNVAKYLKAREPARE